jgi:hypothetical protein
MKKRFLIFSFFVLIALCGFAQTDTNNPVITAVPSLTIAPDARAGGMGDVGAATAPDVNSQYWNPAKYSFMESEVAFLFLIRHG